METVIELAKMIDHSLLHPTMTDTDLYEGFEIAKEYDVASVCVKPYAIMMAKSKLSNTEVKVGTVIGFPHGSSTIAIKVNEAQEACNYGAEELDMVVNIGKALQMDWSYIHDEIGAVNKAAVENGAILKVIFENDFLPTDNLKIKLCEICNDTGVAFVKTSTGYGFTKTKEGLYSYKGATDHDLKLMRKHCSPKIEVKAAGGIRNLKDLLRVKSLGVTRVGATATVAILNEAKNRIAGNSEMQLGQSEVEGY